MTGAHRSLRRRQQQDEPAAAQMQAALAVSESASPGPVGDPAPLRARPARSARWAGASSAGTKVRVYELAKEFGLDSMDVMPTMMAMGEFVRSAASTVEPAVDRKLMERFAASRKSQDRRWDG
jgi:Translation initiation factor IF-2, N-terminal region